MNNTAAEMNSSGEVLLAGVGGAAVRSGTGTGVLVGDGRGGAVGVAVEVEAGSTGVGDEVGVAVTAGVAAPKGARVGTKKGVGVAISRRGGSPRLARHSLSRPCVSTL